MLARKAACDVVGAKNQLAIDMVQMRNRMQVLRNVHYTIGEDVIKATEAIVSCAEQNDMNKLKWKKKQLKKTLKICVCEYDDLKKSTGSNSDDSE